MDVLEVVNLDWEAQPTGCKTKDLATYMVVMKEDMVSKCRRKLHSKGSA